MKIYLRSLLCSSTLLGAFLLAGALLLIGGEALAESETANSEASNSETSTTGRVAVGQKAPPVVLAGADGVVHDSTKVEDGKSLVMVFFRGAW